MSIPSSNSPAPLLGVFRTPNNQLNINNRYNDSLMFQVINGTDHSLLVPPGPITIGNPFSVDQYRKSVGAYQVLVLVKLGGIDYLI